MGIKEPEEISLHGSLRDRLARGVTWNIIGALFSQGSIFLCNIILANILGRTGYGEFGMIQNTTLTLAGVAQLATGYTATKYVAEYRFTDRERTGRILGLCSIFSGGMGCLATFLMLGAAPWLADSLLKAPHLGTGLMIASGSVLFSVLNGYQVGALAGLESYAAIARISAFHGVLHLTICSVAAWQWGLNGALAGFVVSSLLRWIIFYRVLILASVGQAIFFIYKGIWKEAEIILKFALPAALSGLFSMPAIWLVNTFLVRQPEGYSQMGLYSAANSLKTVILILPQLINNVGMSLMNSQKGLGNQASYRNVFWVNLAMTTSVVLAGVIFMTLFGSLILRMFGKDFVSGYPVLIILSFSAIPETLVLAFYQIIQSRAKMWLALLALTLPRDLLIISLAYFLAPLYGAVGLATTYVVAQTVSLILVIAILKQIGLQIHNSTV
jgi:O-antigen/teichoic acid export membrane protein